MNNTQFRRLVLDTPTAAKSNRSNADSALSRGGATPALGSRMRSSIPMTPRSVAGSSGNEFARQLAERNAELNPSNAQKFRSSAAPKGTKLRAGFQDRTQLRTSGEEDDKAVRVKALEEMVQLGQMDQATFEALRDQIVGGNVKDVHLVKGLDYKLLERVRRGEDVLSDRPRKPPSDEDNDQQGKRDSDVDDEFERMEENEIKPLAKKAMAKKGEMAAPPPVAGKKRTRDDILRELKASRLAAAEKAKQSALGPRFMKVGQKRETSRIEKDERGREILITVDAEGNVKRKVKKGKVDNGLQSVSGLLMPDKDIKPLGMEVTPMVPSPSPEDDGDIFEGVGTDYNPLGDVPDDDDSNESDGEGKANLVLEQSGVSLTPEITISEAINMAPPPIPPAKKRNWLGDTDIHKDTVDEAPRNPLTDPTILAALKKAATITPITQETTSEEAAKIARRKKMLECNDRDADDLDMEFGSSRFGDQEDGEDQQQVRLSVWGGDEEDGDGDGNAKVKGPRKRGAKKRKGDVNSAADVLKVMERRKGEGK